MQAREYRDPIALRSLSSVRVSKSRKKYTLERIRLVTNQFSKSVGSHEISHIAAPAWRGLHERAAEIALWSERAMQLVGLDAIRYIRMSWLQQTSLQQRGEGWEPEARIR